MHPGADHTHKSQAPFCFCSVLGCRQPQASLRASIQGEVDSPFTAENLKPSAPHTLGLCLFLSVSKERRDSCTEDGGVGGWDSHPEQARQQALCYWSSVGGPEKWRVLRGSVRGVPAIHGLGNTGTWAPSHLHSWKPWPPWNKQPSLFISMGGGYPPPALDVEGRILAPCEPAKRV